VPRAVTTDRGYGQPAVERDLHELGVRAVVIPRQARTSLARRTIEHSRGFRRLVKWRTSCEGRISYLNAATAGNAPAWTAGMGRDLVRARSIRPQPGQDQHPGQLTAPPRQSPRCCHTHPNSALRLFQVEVANVRHCGNRPRNQPPTIGKPRKYYRSLISRRDD
jgi:hypothetical protein